MHDGAHVAPTLTLPTAPPPRPQVVHVYNDAHAALEYYAEGRPGCVLVAGTGARAGPARRVFERAALARRPAQAGLTRPRARARGRLDRHGQGRRAGHPARGRLGAGVPRRRQRLRPGCGPGCPARAGPDARPGAVQGRTPRRPAAHERRHVRAARRARTALQRETSHALACPSDSVCGMTCLVAKRVCADLGVPNRAARARRAARAGGGGARVRRARPEHRAGRRAVRALPGRGRGRPAGVRARGAGYAACSLPARTRCVRAGRAASET